MKLIFASDIHVDDRHLEALCDLTVREAADVLIIGGDLIPHTRPRLSPPDLLKAHTAYLETVLVPGFEALRQKSACRIYLDLGNDDLWGARSVLEACDGRLFQLLHERRHRLSTRLDIIGYMNVPPTPFARKDCEKADTGQNPFEPGNRILTEGYVSHGGRIESKRLELDSPDTLETDLDRLSQKIERPFIFVSHSPPYDTPLDLLANGLHVGSRAIRHFIEKWAAKGFLPLSLHGHIHEAPFCSGTLQTRIGECLCLNPGQQPGELRHVLLELAETPALQVRLLKAPA